MKACLSDAIGRQCDPPLRLRAAVLFLFRCHGCRNTMTWASSGPTWVSGWGREEHGDLHGRPGSPV